MVLSAPSVRRVALPLTLAKSDFTSEPWVFLLLGIDCRLPRPGTLPRNNHFSTHACIAVAVTAVTAFGKSLQSVGQILTKCRANPCQSAVVSEQAPSSGNYFKTTVLDSPQTDAKCWRTRTTPQIASAF